ncbi:O-antigen ligase [Robiginitalea sp. SC105]|uniref:O-antigen ligase family protein n=1 Tax=Robiginitalea sp. SC105 TaxID=2762332 RepID=UPI00163A1CD0|nr:O-antigen ligase family protein [Robiginitalea sp. SC105]MBC2840332.1 O-antigen ligase family protein [Robiginitalea sp. SC105]
MFQILKYAILFLLLCNIPSYSLAYFGSGLGSLTSYLSTLLLLAYFILAKEKHRPLLPFILLGLTYFILSGLNFQLVDPKNYFLKEFLRFMVLVICGTEVFYRSGTRDIYLILLLGALSIVLNAIFFPYANANFNASYGRFSGFYLNPNTAGVICLIGYALSYRFAGYWKYLGILIFTLAGILTFSRTFIVIWLLITAFSIIKNKRNVILPGIGVLLILLVISFSDKLVLNTERFNALEGIFTQSNVSADVIREDSRTDTWSIYYDQIFEKPFLGHGFLSFQLKGPGLPGVHNSYLMIIGESGIIPFLIMVGIYAFLIIRSVKIFNLRQEYFFLSMVLILALMASHTYFSNFYIVSISMFVYIKVNEIYAKANQIDMHEKSKNFL